MKLAEIKVKCVDISVEALHPITSGMIGATVGFTFDEEWEALDKIVVFRADKVSRDVIGVTDWTSVEVPYEVLETPGNYLKVSVYGYNADKTLAHPSLEAEIGFIRTGADPENDPAANPSLPIYAQLQAQIDELKENDGNSPTESVLYTEQNLTDEQKTQARENIGFEDAVFETLVDLGVAPVLLDGDGAVLTDGDGAILLNI